MILDRKGGAAQYYECPYCRKHEKGHGNKVPKSVGAFRIKVVNSYLLILNCKKCNRIHRITWVGAQILWEDMGVAEKKAFGKHPNYPYG